MKADIQERQGYFNLRCPALSVCQTKSYRSRGRSESFVIVTEAGQILGEGFKREEVK